MFSLYHLDDLAKEASKGIARLNSDILRALGKRVALAQSGGFDRIFALTEADKEADALYMAILRELDRSTATAGEVFSQAARLAYEGMNKYYAAKGLTQIPIEQQRAIVNFVNATASNTKNTFMNLSNTTAIGFRVMDLDGTVKYEGFKTHYHNLVDQAIAEVGTGQTSYNSAIRNALKQTADSGIRVLDYESGYSRRLDSALRQNVLDGVKDIAHEVSMRTGEEFGADGVEIDAHNYCAEDHLPYQGRQFTNKEFEDIQNSLPRQFGQYNCRHTYYPIILGLSEPLYTEDERQAMKEQSTEKIEFEGKQYTRYEATQLQRRIETSVRQSKDRAIIAKASGDDLTRRVEQLRINQLKQKYSEITNTFKTPPALDRMSVSGFRPVGAQKTYPPGWLDVSEMPNDKKAIQIKALNEQNHVLVLGDLPKIYRDHWKEYTSDKWILTGERRNHIYKNHPEMKGFELDLVSMVENFTDILKNKADTQMAIIYRKFNDHKYFRLALWISDRKEYMNSIHSFRFADKREYLSGLKANRSIIKKPR
ncbi:MAG: phage minor capsid protein [Candidatus Cloacimonadaceae bacterium]